MATNLDIRTVKAFGEEWSTYDQSQLSGPELRRRFWEYFSIFPLNNLRHAEGFDLGCGTGRWSGLLAYMVGHLHCIEPATKALDVARRNLASRENVSFHHACADTIPLADESQDFGVALGVLHHTPDPEAALRQCVRKLRAGAPMLVYLYYRFDNRPLWFRAVWKASDILRHAISAAPFPVRRTMGVILAAAVYWPLARVSRILASTGMNVTTIPLSYYRRCSFYTMKTDALDRFGTRIEHRFTREEVAAMMSRTGLKDIRFSETVPHWIACGYKGAHSTSSGG